jgi:hypothetical protein
VRWRTKHGFKVGDYGYGRLLGRKLLGPRSLRRRDPSLKILFVVIRSIAIALILVVAGVIFYAMIYMNMKGRKRD